MHAPEITTVQDPGPAVFPARFRNLLLAAAGVGIVIFAVALAVNPQRAWYSFLDNFMFFLILGLAGTFLSALQAIVNATWSVPFRRLSESLASYVPVAAIFAIILLFGVHQIYPWAKTGFHFEAHSKQFYFSMPFYTIRTVVYVGLWSLLTWLLIRMSVKQDKNPESLPERKTFGNITTLRGRISALFMVTFAYTFTLATVDWVMSLEPHWDTTMWGVYIFAGLFESGLALVLLMAVLMRRRGMLGTAVRDHHYVDLSRMLHAFSIFMVYIGFAQYMLIWYADYREETVYFHQRIAGGWAIVFFILLFVKWVLPFTVLMNQKVRTNEKVLITVPAFILFAEWLDVYWLIMPSIHSSFYFPGWVEIGVFLAFFGIFGTVVTRFLSRHSTIPVGDPRLVNSVAGRYL